MAKIEGRAVTVIALTEVEVESMLNSVKGKEEFWIRMVVEINDPSSPVENSVIAYLQGPDGEEELIFNLDQGGE